MGVLKHGAAHAVVAHQRADAGQRYIQTGRLGKLRREEAKPYFAVDFSVPLPLS
jgi:hypothetical protein